MKLWMWMMTMMVTMPRMMTMMTLAMVTVVVVMVVIAMVVCPNACRSCQFLWPVTVHCMKPARMAHLPLRCLLTSMLSTRRRAPVARALAM